jgi:hypothetical protein
MYLIKILDGLIAIWVTVHGGLSFLPVSWANLSEFVGVLESGNKSDELVGVSSNWKVTDGGVSKNSLLINDVCGSESNTSITTILDEASVILGDLLGKIGEHWDFHVSESSLLSVFFGPLLVGEVRVDGARDNLAVEFVEFGLLVRELNDLSWADEGEVEWVEEKDDVFALELLETDLLELLVPPGHTLKGWCWLSDDGFVSFHIDYFGLVKLIIRYWIKSALKKICYLLTN